MGHYKSNVRDLEFNLFEVLDLEKVLATGEFGDLDGESVREMLAEAARQAEGPLAESFAESDRHPPTFDPEHAHRDHRASRSRSRSARGSRASGSASGCPRRSAECPRRPWWPGRSTSSRSAPSPRRSCTSRARCSPTSCTTSATSSRSIGPQWPSTATGAPPWCSPSPMPARTSAPDAPRPSSKPDGTWHLDGVKRFITNGDSDDLFENIVHMVLARPEGAGPGTKGLSLFLVPKFLIDPETGEPGERNGVYVTGLEHKMGLKASATCELTFGQHDRPAVG